MYIPRTLEEKIRGGLKSPEIIAVVGPRQAGKTTLLRHIASTLSNINWITFEDREILDLFDRDIHSFIALHIKPFKTIFIDEFQYSQEGGKHLKLIYDTEPGKKILISGSSHIDLTIHALRFLVGRVSIYELFPLSFAEFLRQKDDALFDFVKSNKSLSFQVEEKLYRHLNAFVRFGAYPRVVLESSEERKKEVLRDIANTYFLRDVRDALGLVAEAPLRDLLKTLALCVGGLIEYKKLSEVTHYGHETLKKMLAFLEKTYILSPVKPFFANKLKEITKTPKINFIDPGLRNHLVGDFRSLEDRPDAGGLLEMTAGAELLKLSYGVQYWRDKQQREVDIVAHLEHRMMALEIKLREESGKLSSLKFFNTLYPRAKTLLVYAKPTQKTSGKIGKQTKVNLAHFLIKNER